jgi:phospholipase A1
MASNTGLFEANAQTLTLAAYETSVRKITYLAIYKDNYFITGVPTNKVIKNETANAKYQISFKQMITRTKLPLDTQLFITYSQEAFWYVYKESLPFREINFNPLLGINKPIFDKNDRLKGIAGLSFEHESKGRDSIFQRTWNSLNLEYANEICKKTVIKTKLRLPFKYGEGNPDILNYVGLGQIDISYEIKPDQLYLALTLGKGLKWDSKGTFRSRLYYNPHKNISNQYFMIEWYIG